MSDDVSRWYDYIEDGIKCICTGTVVEAEKNLRDRIDIAQRKGVTRNPLEERFSLLQQPYSAQVLKNLATFRISVREIPILEPGRGEREYFIESVPGGLVTKIKVNYQSPIEEAPHGVTIT